MGKKKNKGEKSEKKNPKTSHIFRPSDGPANWLRVEVAPTLICSTHYKRLENYDHETNSITFLFLHAHVDAFSTTKEAFRKQRVSGLGLKL